MSAHRVKAYSAESGYVFQYSFQMSRRAKRGWLTSGNEYIFEVSRDRKTAYMLPVFVRDDAARAWAKRHGRALSEAECYAAAKMCLFRTFDRAEDPEQEIGEAIVDAESIDALIEPLGIA
jgi:hypothetical protein